MPGGVARVPDAPGPLGHPAGCERLPLQLRQSRQLRYREQESGRLSDHRTDTAISHQRPGFYGIEKLSLSERALIFSTLGILVWVAGKKFVSQLIPGSRQHLSVGAFLTIGSAALLGVFALVFRDYHTDHFISAGIACLLTGLLLAIPAAFLSWLLLRRGFAVNSVAAGLVGGALAGLSGVTMLELHCANFQAPHVLVWHTAVVPVSAAAGALVGWALRRHSTQA